MIITRSHSFIVVHVVCEVKKETMPRDPVCGVVLDENTTKFSITHDGETYYFCCLKCKKRFKRNAAKFVK
jgi:YHS domain-containing protein